MRKAIVALLLVAGAAHAEHVGLEPRAGVQAVRKFPSLGVYLDVGVGHGFSVGVGYEMLRAFEASLKTSTDTAIAPIVAGGLRGGVWRVFPWRHGLYAKVGLLAGVAAPVLTPARVPWNAGGAALDVAADLSVGWSVRFFRAALFVSPGFSVGSLHGSLADEPSVTDSTSVTQGSLHAGLLVAGTL